MLMPLDYIMTKHGVNPRNILHVGASTGQERDAYSKIHAHVTWIEADPETYRQLCLNLNGYSNQFAVNACVSDTDDQEVTFNRTNNEGQSSSFLELGTHARVHPSVKVTDRIKLKTSRIDSLIAKAKIMSACYFDFINFDIQGAELLALKGMGDHINTVKWAYLEVNWDYLYKGCPLFKEVNAFMNEHGFELAETRESGRTKWGDALFIRK